MSGEHHLVPVLMLVLPLSALFLVMLPSQSGLGWMFWFLGAASAILWWLSWAGRYPQTEEERIIGESSVLLMSGFSAIASWPTVFSLLVWLRRRLAGASHRSTRSGQMALLLVGSAPTGLLLLLLASGK